MKILKNKMIPAYKTVTFLVISIFSCICAYGEVLPTSCNTADFIPRTTPATKHLFKDFKAISRNGEVVVRDELSIEGECPTPYDLLIIMDYLPYSYFLADKNGKPLTKFSKYEKGKQDLFIDVVSRAIELYNDRSQKKIRYQVFHRPSDMYKKGFAQCLNQYAAVWLVTDGWSDEMYKAYKSNMEVYNNYAKHHILISTMGGMKDDAASINDFVLPGNVTLSTSSQGFKQNYVSYHPSGYALSNGASSTIDMWQEIVSKSNLTPEKLRKKLQENFLAFGMPEVPLLKIEEYFRSSHMTFNAISEDAYLSKDESGIYLRNSDENKDLELSTLTMCEYTVKDAYPINQGLSIVSLNGLIWGYANSLMIDDKNQLSYGKIFANLVSYIGHKVKNRFIISPRGKDVHDIRLPLCLKSSIPGTKWFVKQINSPGDFIPIENPNSVFLEEVDISLWSMVYVKAVAPDGSTDIVGLDVYNAGLYSITLDEKIHKVRIDKHSNYQADGYTGTKPLIVYIHGWSDHAVSGVFNKLLIDYLKKFSQISALNDVETLVYDLRQYKDTGLDDLESKIWDDTENRAQGLKWKHNPGMNFYFPRSDHFVDDLSFRGSLPEFTFSELKPLLKNYKGNKIYFIGWSAGSQTLTRTLDLIMNDAELNPIIGQSCIDKEVIYLDPYWWGGLNTNMDNMITNLSTQNFNFIRYKSTFLKSLMGFHVGMIWENKKTAEEVSKAIGENLKKWKGKLTKEEESESLMASQDAQELTDILPVYIEKMRSFIFDDSFKEKIPTISVKLDWAYPANSQPGFPAIISQNHIKINDFLLQSLLLTNRKQMPNFVAETGVKVYPVPIVNYIPEICHYYLKQFAQDPTIKSDPAFNMSQISGESTADFSDDLFEFDGRSTWQNSNQEMARFEGKLNGFVCINSEGNCDDNSSKRSGNYQNDGLSVNPIPAASFVEIQYNVVDDGVVKMEVVDVLGVIKKTINSNVLKKGDGYHLTLNIEDLPSGVYNLILSAPSTIKRSKLFIKL